MERKPEKINHRMSMVKSQTPEKTSADSSEINDKDEEEVTEVLKMIK